MCNGGFALNSLQEYFWGIGPFGENAELDMTICGNEATSRSTGLVFLPFIFVRNCQIAPTATTIKRKKRKKPTKLRILLFLLLSVYISAKLTNRSSGYLLYYETCYITGSNNQG